jgi:hypothetical protein
MMLRRILFALLALIVAPVYLLAQAPAVPALQGSVLDSVGLPGEGWSSLGNLSPVEHNNGYSQSYVEQSAAIFANNSGLFTVTPFVSLGLVLDTKGYDWNNKIQPRMGIRANKFFHHGVVSVGSAYSYEERFKSTSSNGLTLFAQDWFGWQSVFEKSSRFPGSSWAAVGTLSPIEHGNIIGQGYASQGVVAKRFGRTALVPYVETTLSRDSKGFDWENKVTYGSGIKFSIPRNELYTEIGACYLHETRFESGQSAGGVTLYMNFSFSWNLLNRKVGK